MGTIWTRIGLTTTLRDSTFISLPSDTEAGGPASRDAPSISQLPHAESEDSFGRSLISELSGIIAGEETNGSGTSISAQPVAEAEGLANWDEPPGFSTVGDNH